MKTLKKMLPTVHRDQSSHITSLVFGLFFGIIGAISKAEINSLLGQAIYSTSVGLFIGFFMALSMANSENCTAKIFVGLIFSHAVRITIVSFLFMLIASAFR